MSSGNSTILFRCFASFDKVEGTFAIGQRNVGFLVSHDDSKTFKFASNTIGSPFIAFATMQKFIYSLLKESCVGQFSFLCAHYPSTNLNLLFDMLYQSDIHHSVIHTEKVKFISRETPAPGAYKVLVETSEGRSLIFDILGTPLIFERQNR
jgi:hypothetical protein